MKNLLTILLLLVSLPVWAADRYWVGGGGTWDSSSTANWSTSSGGSSGASAPTSSDNVFIDANSGAGTILVATAVTSAALDFNGYTGTFNLQSGGGSVTASGNIRLASGMTYTGTGVLSQNGGTQFTSAGKTITTSYTVANTSATIVFQDAFSSSSTIVMSASGAHLDTNGQSVTVSTISFISGTTMSLGASTVEVTGTGTVFNAGGTLNAGTSTLKVSNASASAKTVNPNGATFNNIWFTGSGSGTFALNNNGTFNNFRVDTPPHTIQITAGRNITFSTFTVSGTSGNLMTFQSSSAGSAFTFTASTGNVVCTYCSLKDSTATGGASFYAPNSTNVSGNTGWTFSAPPSGGGYGFSLFTIAP